jgi:succinyl-diaminopimelate desuccinylase
MDYVKILSDLISIDTSVPPGDNYGEIVDYLIPLFQTVGFQTQRVEIPAGESEGRAGRVNLVCHRRDTGKPRLIFYAHVDVVPAQGWLAFKARIERGKIYGRGAADMKGAIPALLLALKKSKASPLNYDTSVMITTDEEYSQASQLRYLGRYLQPVKDSYVFDLDSSSGFVSIAALGALQIDIKVTGRSVHSGLSHLGENAVEKAIPVLNALMDLKGKVAQRKSAVPASPATGLDKMVARLNINVVRGGLKVNIIPDGCLISIDRRLVPEENVEEARKEIMDVLSAVPNVSWEIEREFAIPTLEPCDNPITDELAAIVKEVTGEGGKYGEMGSGDLGNIVEKEWGAKLFGLGVIRPESNIHGNNEFVYQKDIESLAEIINRFLTLTPQHPGG